MKLRLISLAMLALLVFSSCRDQLNGPSPTPFASDTIALWNFNGNLTDVTGNGHNGTITGTTTYGPDRFGNANSAMVLDGKTFVSVADKSDIDFTGDNSFTISAWVKTTDSNAMGIVAKGPANGSEPGYQLDLNTIELGLWASITTASQNPGWGDAFPTDVSDGRWHMLTMVVTAHTGIALYTDSMLEVTDNDAGLEPELNNTASLLLGTDPTKTKFFQGSLDEVTILGRAIDPVEVQARFHEGGWNGHHDTITTPPPAQDTGWVAGNFGTTQSILGICFPYTPAQGWACGTNGILLTSSDSGETWHAQPSSTTQDLYRISFSPTAPIIGIVAGNNGTVLRTTDAQNWAIVNNIPFNTVNGTLESVRDVKFLDATHVMMVGGSGSTQTAQSDGFVMVSSDAGVTWTRSMTAPIGIYSIGNSTQNPFDVSVVGSSGEIYRTTDAGVSWNNESINSAGDDFMSVAFTSLNSSQSGMATTAEGIIYVTSDGGMSWGPGGSTGVTSSLRTVNMLSISEAWVAGDNGVILHTTNDGINWTPVEFPQPNSYQWNDIVARDTHTLAFVGSNGGLFWYRH